MQHLCYSIHATEFKTALLIKEEHFDGNLLHHHYIAPLEQKGIDKNDIILIALPTGGKKLTAAQTKTVLTDILDDLKSIKIQNIIIADSAFYKVMAKVTKTENMHGEMRKGVFPGYEDFNVFLSINYMAIKHNAAVQEKLSHSLSRFAMFQNHNGKLFDESIIKTIKIPVTPNEIVHELEALQKYDDLTCDIETFGLRFNSAGLGTISFAWNKHEGLVFDVQHSRPNEDDVTAIYNALQHFFETYKGQLAFHNALFDCKILIYEIFMRGVYDLDLLHKGIDVFANVDDTMIMTYLAINSTQQTKLGLKANAYEFTGNYAKDDEDIKDIRRIPLDELLEYNLIDSCATWYIKEKYQPIMIAENQENLYNTIFQPSIAVLLKMMLIGLPIDPEKVHSAEDELHIIMERYLNVISRSPLYSILNFNLRLIEQKKANNKLKRKIKSIRNFANTVFNPGSDLQKQFLLYDLLGLEPIDFTDTGAPAVGKKTLAKLLARLTVEHKITDEELE